MRTYKILALLAISSFISVSCFSQLQLPQFFSNGMVLQRNKPIKVWGWAKAGTEVQLSFSEHTIKVQTKADGSWMASLPSMKASSTPQTLSISNGNTKLEIKDVLVGDVWLCSGQSNMDYSIRSFSYAQSEKAKAQFPNIRTFRIKKGLSHQEEENIPGGKWMSAEGKNVLLFSATAYFFGKNLYQELAVPIGLITSSWGGTNVEAWTPASEWDAFPEMKNAYQDQSQALRSMSLQERKAEVVSIIKENVNDGIGLSEKWYDPMTDLSSWSNIHIPQKKGNGLFRDMDGAVWFRKSFEIPLPFRGKDLIANLGQMDDHDMVWINGHKIGESQRRTAWRNYLINKEHLKEGLNEIVVRVFDYEEDGGYVTDPYFINIHPAGDKKGYYLLSGDWKYKVGKTLYAPLKLPKVPSNEGRMANVTPSSLYNQMIHPLRKLPMSGAIWYQGETNSARGYEYQAFFPNMIKGWRKAFEQEDFPFFFVQLPNFRGKNRDGTLSNWPELRAAQTEALKLPKTGMAVTIDIGLENDIHPPNKQDVGKRLALAAMNVHYQKNKTYQGPNLQKVKAKKNALILTFDQVGNGIQSGKEGENYGLQINNFEIAGPDNNFHKAHARIVGKNQIKVWSPKVSKPINVRYAWKNSPSEVNFYNSFGLPAPPFQTGNWEWKTRDKKYINDIK